MFYEQNRKFYMIIAIRIKIIVQKVSSDNIIILLVVSGSKSLYQGIYIIS